MNVLKIDDFHYIWYAGGKWPYTISLEDIFPYLQREPIIPNYPEHMQKRGLEKVPWERLPEPIKRCIVAAQSTFLESVKEKQDEEKDK
jgi:hypothetical protein